MDTIFNNSVLANMESTGWSTILDPRNHGEGSSAFAESMAEPTSEALSLIVHKQQRLSKLLEKLSVQLSNNQYPFPHWLMRESSPNGVRLPDDVPLDLSIKSEVPKPSPPPVYACEICGQTFTVHDRLAKHIASRHRGKASKSSRAYECDICHRRFARSDMLTRHARSHSGVKPYSCAVCGQVFSRSDHLATHQRTHTGEKPYHCPKCPYAACRRDMITRHMRTHTRRQHIAEI
ncbi:unnamed protein product [Pieris brassicae]|uniref:C2H2-type domain-containing protein n=1 Tax=Pieris brassicae TaxID=7116 RepID=A0A9P0XHE4_PIEBR|nr:unnamed protein product [Pieris brassicae]